MRLLLLLCCLAAFRLLWPGDAPFIADEPRFLKLALDSAERGELPRHSLKSTRGPYHGPLVVWLHRAGLSVTGDLQRLHFLRILLFTAGLVASLYGLSRLFPGLPPWALTLPLLSPFFWLRSRDLWDNSLLIPLCAGTLTAYLSFLNDGRFRWLVTAALCGTLAFLTHLMALPLLGVLFVHFLLRRGDFLRLYPGRSLGLAALCLALAGPYLQALLPGLAEGGGGAGRPWQALGFAFLGTQLFTTVGFEAYVGDWGPVLPAALLTVPAYFVAWYGMARCLRRPGLEGETGAICLAVFTAFVVITVKTQPGFRDHYYHGVWPALFFFLWVGLAEFGKGKWVCRWAAGYAAALALSVGLSAWIIHERGGNRASGYGPSLESQLRVIRELNGAPFELGPEVENPYLPLSLGVLRELHGSADGPPRMVEYAHPERPGDARLRVN